MRLVVSCGEHGEAAEEGDEDLKLVEIKGTRLGLGKANAIPVEAMPPVLARHAEEDGTVDGDRARGGGAAVGCISTGSFGSFQGVMWWARPWKTQKKEAGVSDRTLRIVFLFACVCVRRMAR